MRKSIFCHNTNNKDADQSAYPRSLTSVFPCIVLSFRFYTQNFKILVSFFFWEGRFDSYLLANPKNKLSRYVAQMYITCHGNMPDCACCPPTIWWAISGDANDDAPHCTLELPGCALLPPSPVSGLLPEFPPLPVPGLKIFSRSCHQLLFCIWLRKWLKSGTWFRPLSTAGSWAICWRLDGSSAGFAESL